MIALLFVAALAGQADPDVEARLSETFSICMDAAGGVTSEMLDCTGAETERQDAQLNAVYRRVRAAASAADQIELRDAQRAWIRARDARCASRRADAGGGTLSSVVFASCHMTETAERVIWLENWEN